MSSQNSNERLQVSFGNKSDVGKVRQKNEDYMEKFLCDFGDVFVVCDGMGGHIGGEVASRLAVYTIKEFMTENPKAITETSTLIKEAMIAANDALHNKTKENPDLKGMGTTCVILVLKNGNAYIGNVGDSRMYMIRGGAIHQITKDQSFVQELVDQGIISYEEAENHPRRNEILQALGVNMKLEPQLNPGGMKIYKNDTFILCSDGLSGMVSDKDILNITGQSEPMDACEKLVSLANMNGGTDNITLQIAKIINGEILPDDLKNIPPQGSLSKDIIPPSPARFDKTREISNESDSGFGLSQKKKSNTMLYIIGGVLVLAMVMIFLWYFFLRGKGGIEEIQTMEKTQVDESNKEYKTITEKLNGFLKEKLYRGKNIDDNLKFPADIRFEKFKYKPDRDSKPKEIGFSDLKSDIKTRDLWLIELKGLTVDKGVYNYKMYLKVGNKDERVPYEIIINRIDDNILEINEILYYVPPTEPVKEENRETSKPKTQTQQKEQTDGKDDQQKKNDETVIDKTKKEGEKVKEKVEEKIDDAKKKLPGDEK